MSETPPYVLDFIKAICPEAPAFRVGKKAAGRLLDGKLHDEYPA